MIRPILIISFLVFLINPLKSLADAVDVWTVKLNGKAIIHSNQTEIVFDNHPMQIKLASLSDNDVLEICYWTDSGLQLNKWYYIFKTTSNVVLDKFVNPLDISLGKDRELRKNSISFSVKNLKQLFKSKGIAKILVEFEQEDKGLSSSYLHKAICVITIN